MSEPCIVVGCENPGKVDEWFTYYDQETHLAIDPPKGFTIWWCYEHLGQVVEARAMRQGIADIEESIR
jgi:hypothetical protein